MSTRSSASLGKRLLPALAMTTAASGLIALLDQPSRGSASNASGRIAGASTVAPDQGVAGATVPPPVSSTLPVVAVQPSAVPVQPVPAPQPTETTQVAVAAGACQGKTMDGQTIDTRWGPVQVEAVVSAS